MQLGMVGLGRMGGNMAERLLRAGHEVVGTSRTRKTVDEAAARGVKPVYSVPDLVAALAPPRAVWIMVPAGKITEAVVHQLSELLEPGDAIIDGGNSYYHDDIRHAEMLKEKGIHFVDCGTSGGVWGLERGYCLMIGGEAATVRRLEDPPPSGARAPSPARWCRRVANGLARAPALTGELGAPALPETAGLKAS